MDELVIVGADSFVGTALLFEALSRDHRVLAIGGDAGKVPFTNNRMRSVAIDTDRTPLLTKLLKGHSTLIAVMQFNGSLSMATTYCRSVMAAAEGAGVGRTIICGPPPASVNYSRPGRNDSIEAAGAGGDNVRNFSEPTDPDHVYLWPSGGLSYGGGEEPLPGGTKAPTEVWRFAEMVMDEAERTCRHVELLDI